ncbi:MAG: hypothetical protein B6D41_04525, partial [Chloroflexi bacterium UTCFX4]
MAIDTNRVTVSQFPISNFPARSFMQGLEQIEEKIRQTFVAKNAARDAALAKSREVIRHCSLSIRASHRAEYENAAQILETAR